MKGEQKIPVILSKRCDDYILKKPINFTAYLKVLPGSMFLFLRTFLFMTFYAQTSSWGI